MRIGVVGVRGRGWETLGEEMIRLNFLENR